VVLDEVPAEDGSLGLEVRIPSMPPKPARGAASADWASPIRSNFAIASAGTPSTLSAMRR